MTEEIKQPKKFGAWGVALSVVLIIFLTALPLVINKNSKFGGTDDAGSKAVTQIAPAYDSSRAGSWRKPSSEIESLLFALQSAAGGVLIGYFFGFAWGRKKGREENAASSVSESLARN